MINYYFLIPFIILLILKILFSVKENELLKYILTPLTTISIIVFPLLYLINNTDTYVILITLALIFSLVGDMFNMMEKGDLSKLQFGMIFFLIAHIIYIYNFYKGYSFSLYHIGFGLVLILFVSICYMLFKNKLTDMIMKVGLIFYMLAVSGTMFFAIGNLNAGATQKSILISTGASIFLLSDLFLGIHYFWKEIRSHEIIVWGLYAPAQLLIALSCYY